MIPVIYDSDRLKRQVPERRAAVKKIRESPEKLKKAIERTIVIKRNKKQIKEFRKYPLTKAEALEAVRQHRDHFDSERVFPWVCNVIHQTMVNGSFKRNFTRTRLFDLVGELFLTLVPDETLNKAAEAVIEPENVLTKDERETMIQKIKKETETAEKWISKNIPTELIGPHGATDFWRSEIFEALKSWQDIQSQCRAPVDPYKMQLTDSNVFNRSFTILGMAEFVNPNGQWWPAKFVPGYHRD